MIGRAITYGLLNVWRWGLIAWNKVRGKGDYDGH